jgi:hypothetical protein
VVRVNHIETVQKKGTVNGFPFLKEKAMIAKQYYRVLFIACSVLPAGMSGCVPILPPPEAALEGTWELIPEDTVDPRLTDWFFTFDSRGRLTEVEYTIVGGDTVTWQNPSGSTEVDDDQVHISVTFPTNGITFDGTLDSTKEPTIATGVVSVTVTIGGIEISEEEAAATLVKQ